MAALVLVTTLVTHLFGGSAGREGTAVQMGGSLAEAYRRLLRISTVHQRMLLMAGIAAGFGSVFGTPLTGAIFAMEVLFIGRMQDDVLIPVLVVSRTTRPARHGCDAAADCWSSRRAGGWWRAVCSETDEGLF